MLMIIGYHMLMIIAIILYWLVILTILETYELMVVWYRAVSQDDYSQYMEK